MQPDNARGRPTRERPRDSYGWQAEPKGTAPTRPPVPCPPRCALRCTLPAAWWQHLPDQPDPWWIAYALHGLGPGKPPVPPHEYATSLRWFAAVWDVPTVAAGLRHAASIPPVHGSGVDRGRLQALAVVWGEHAREVTA